jgi:hypothetical protein
MELINFVKFSAGIIATDWKANGKFLVRIAAATAFGILLVLRLGPGAEFARGILSA